MREDKSINKTVPPQSTSDETCYVSVTESGEYDELIVSSISISLISQFHKRVTETPLSGLSEREECVYKVSVDSRDYKTFVTIISKDLNTSGDSKISGIDGLQQSLIRSIYNGLPNKRIDVCKSYSSKLDECKGGSEELQDKLIGVQEKELNQLQKEIITLEQKLKKSKEDRLNLQYLKKREIEYKEKQKEEVRKTELIQRRGFLPKQIRFRGLYGHLKNNEKKVTNSTFRLIYKKYGIGLTQLKYNSKSSRNDKFN